MKPIRTQLIVGLFLAIIPITLVAGPASAQPDSRDTLEAARRDQQSILRKAAEEGLAPGKIQSPANDPERQLMLAITRFPEVLGRSVEFRAPNHLAEYAYDVVVAFNRFYEACHILREEDAARQASWLRLVDATLGLLTRLLELLGIEVPERM